jgi:HAD superfamily hydrolase (TIGR01490 family)
VSRIVFVDVDYTLVRVSTAQLFIRYERGVGLAPWSRVIRVGYWNLKYSLGWLDAQQLALHALSWYRGRTEQDLRRHTAVWFTDWVVPQLSSVGLERIAQHRSAGDHVVLATAANRYVCERIAEYAGVDQFLCTEVEIVDGRLTGQLDGAVCFGQEKARRALKLARQTGCELSTFYTDSITDRPLLDVVTTPVAVNPDLRLGRLAQRRAWPVERW